MVKHIKVMINFSAEAIILPKTQTATDHLTNNCRKDISKFVNLSLSWQVQTDSAPPENGDKTRWRPHSVNSTVRHAAPPYRTPRVQHHNNRPAPQSRTVVPQSSPHFRNPASGHGRRQTHDHERCWRPGRSPWSMWEYHSWAHPHQETNERFYVLGTGLSTSNLTEILISTVRMGYLY